MGFMSNVKPYNTIFKQFVINSLYADFWIIPETHCRLNEKLELENYTVYQNNRKSPEKNRRGSGGIAIAVSNSILVSHTILNISKGIDGQISIKLQNRLNEFTIGVVGFYLSPDSYVYGQDAENFFSEAAAMWEDLMDCDLLVGSGDLNARTKDMIDYLPDVDGIVPTRYNPDLKKNSHGNNFITFLKDTRSIILNGRVTPQYNDFTFVSPRGSSVPDYMMCPLNHLVYCEKMETLLIKDVVNKLSIPPPQSLPDHSILTGTFLISSFEHGQPDKNAFKNNDTIMSALKPKNVKKNLRKIDETFFISEEVCTMVTETIAKIENCQKNQDELNKLWCEIKQLFLKEMSSLPNISTFNCKKQKRSFRKAQPFWNNELSNLWFSACQAEKVYLKKPHYNSGLGDNRHGGKSKTSSVYFSANLHSSYIP